MSEQSSELREFIVRFHLLRATTRATITTRKVRARNAAAAFHQALAIENQDDPDFEEDLHEAEVAPSPAQRRKDDENG